MNTRKMKKYIKKYGVIVMEYKREPDYYYKNGSYYVSFDSDILDFYASCGDHTKHKVYKRIMKFIQEEYM